MASRVTESTEADALPVEEALDERRRFVVRGEPTPVPSGTGRS
jgi:hypothetical protein